MKDRIISESALKRINGIHHLSQRYNAGSLGCHQKKLLELVRHHIEEIEALAAGGDPHFLTETGDLIILCFEILLENGASLDEILSVCFSRYEDKLTALIKKAQRAQK